MFSFEIFCLQQSSTCLSNSVHTADTVLSCPCRRCEL